MKPYQNPICLFVAIPAEDLIRTSTGLTNAGVGNANSLQGVSVSVTSGKIQPSPYVTCSGFTAPA